MQRCACTNLTQLKSIRTWRLCALLAASQPPARVNLRRVRSVLSKVLLALIPAAQECEYDMYLLLLYECFLGDPKLD